MISREQIAAFKRSEDAYFATQEAAKELDPLNVQTTDFLQPYQQDQTPVDIAPAIEAANNWLDNNPSPTTAEAIALRRDFDKITGHLVGVKRKTAEQPMDDTLARIHALDGISPRANIYDYSFGTQGNEATTYTRDDREIRIIDIFNRSLAESHAGTHAVIEARALTAAGASSAEIEENLDEALGHVHEMKLPMIEAYRAVGPDFVTQRLTRFLGGFATSFGRFEGPNPGHSGFLVLDRLVYGDFKPIYEGNDYLTHMFKFRMSDLPPHLMDIITQLDETHADEPLNDAVQHVSAKALELSNTLSQEVRKFKVIHKSYADKGLAALGRTLNPDEPDILTPTIAYARQAEIE